MARMLNICYKKPIYKPIQMWIENTEIEQFNVKN